MISRANEIGSEGKKECSEEQTKAITGIVTGDCSGQRVQARHPCPREASLGGLYQPPQRSFKSGAVEEEYHSSIPVIGKPAWQHFYRYLCGGRINPQNQGILLQMIFLKLSMDLTIISGHSGKRRFFPPLA